jgi:magnesium and cobalt exporter, CNNM family
LDNGWLFKLVLLLIFFILSAFFSGSEVALFSLDRKKINNDIQSGTLFKRYLLSLLEYPRRLLVTILIGNTIVNVAASIVAVTLALDYAEIFKLSKNLVLTLQIIILTVFIVIFGELVPKLWATKYPMSFAKVVTIPLYWTSVIFYPISETLTELIKLFVSKIKFDKSKTAILPEDIYELANLSHERGTIEDEEHGLISSIVSFKSVTAREVMTPRVDIISLSSTANFNEVLDAITTSAHSRIPLYEDDLDRIIGFVYAKDLLPYVKNEEMRGKFNLKNIVRKSIFVPETKMIEDLMHEFQEKKMHIAIVVDEYGGTAGLITLEDILEEIIGEIRDESDKEENPFTRINEKSFLALGKLPIDELTELLDIEIDKDNHDFETLGGLILNYAGHIPKEGYSFNINNYKFTVKEILNKRIKRVLIEKLPTG